MLETKGFPLFALTIVESRCCSLFHGFLSSLQQPTSIRETTRWASPAVKTYNDHALPVCRAQRQSGRCPAHPGLCGGCCTLPPAGPGGWPAGQSRPPPPADAPRGSTAAAPARAGLSPAGRSAARMPGHSLAPGGLQRRHLKVNTRIGPCGVEFLVVGFLRFVLELILNY